MGPLKNPAKCLQNVCGVGSPTVGTTSTSSSVRLHICAVTSMTEISLMLRKTPINSTQVNFPSFVRISCAYSPTRPSPTTWSVRPFSSWTVYVVVPQGAWDCWVCISTNITWVSSTRRWLVSLSTARDPATITRWDDCKEHIVPQKIWKF